MSEQVEQEQQQQQQPECAELGVEIASMGDGELLDIMIFRGGHFVATVMVGEDVAACLDTDEDEVDYRALDREQIALAFKMAGSEKMFDALDSIRQICCQNIPPGRRLGLIEEVALRAREEARQSPLSEHFPIRPSDIETRRHFFAAFNSMETETSARYIVMLCQKRGNWGPFTFAELAAFYRECGQTDGFWFNGLDNPEWLRLGKREAGGNPDTVTVTAAFVERCYASSPASKPEVGNTTPGDPRPQMAGYPTRPSDIDARDSFHAFETVKVPTNNPAFALTHLPGTYAKFIVRFCQLRGDWSAFTEAEMNAFYHNERRRYVEEERAAIADFPYDGLDSGGFIERVTMADGEKGICVTHAFVQKCFDGSPAQKPEPDNPTPGEAESLHRQEMNAAEAATEASSEGPNAA